MQTTLDAIDDELLQLHIAEDFYENNAPGNYVLYKTTRAGCSSGLIAAAINNGMKVLHIIPTHKIASETSNGTTLEYCKNKDAWIFNVPANKNCLLNKYKCDVHPDLLSLLMMTMEYPCDECDLYQRCHMTANFRREANGMSIVMPKLLAMCLTPSPENVKRPGYGRRQLDKSRDCHVVIIDEADLLAYGTRVEEPLILLNGEYNGDKTELLPVSGMVDGKPRRDPWKHVRQVIAAKAMLCRNMEIKAAYKRVIDKAREKQSYWQNALSETIQNPVEVELCTDDIVATVSEITDLMVSRMEYGLSKEEVAELCKDFFLVTSQNLTIYAVRSEGEIVIKISAINNVFGNILRWYLFEHERRGHYIIFTSGTHCSDDYRQYVKSPLFEQFWGGKKYKGDPKQTNRMMTVYFDKEGYSQQTGERKKRMLLKDANRLLWVIKKHGAENVAVFFISEKKKWEMERLLLSLPEYNELKEKPLLTYYRSDICVGIGNHRRVGVCFGLAWMPANAFDSYKSTKEKSDILREENVHSASFQAMSRCKDAQGKEESIIYAFHCTHDQVIAACTWGIGRKVIENYDLNSDYEYTVETRLSIPMPKILPLPKIN